MSKEIKEQIKIIKKQFPKAYVQVITDAYLRGKNGAKVWK